MYDNLIILEINKLVSDIDDNYELLEKICLEIKDRLKLDIHIYDNILQKEYFNSILEYDYISKHKVEKNNVSIIFFDRYNSKDFDDILIAYLETIIYMIVRNIENYEKNISNKEKDDVKNVMDKLSYSELMAIVRIFEDFQLNEQTIIASKIAQNNNLTRSSIVNAIRKLESAKIIESYSLGVKGTHIKITNHWFLSEIKKLI